MKWYTEEEVQSLIEDYIDLMPQRTRGYVHIRVMDIQRAAKRMPTPLLEAVFLHGVCCISSKEAGRILGVSASTVRRRYLNGIEWLTSFLNGGYHSRKR